MREAMEILTAILVGISAAGIFLALLVCVAGLFLLDAYRRQWEDDQAGLIPPDEIED